MSQVHIIRSKDVAGFIYSDDPDTIYVLSNVIEDKNNDIYIFDAFNIDMYLGSCVELDIYGRKLCVPCGGD